MNPDDPSEPHLIPVGDAELEARIVAWVLGEASAFEAAELERLCEERPELRLFEQRIRSLHDLVKEDFHPLPGEEWRLPAEKREKVTALFGDVPALAENERQRKVNRYFTRRALLATAACLAVTAAVSWPYLSRNRVGVAGEKDLATAGGGNEMSPEQQQRYYEELQKAVKTQEDTVEDKRQALQTIIRTEGIVYDPARGGGSAFGDTQTANVASKAYAETEQSRIKHESEIDTLLNYDGERLIQYAAGLDLPDNLTKVLYPQYLAAKRTLEAEKGEQGRGENHPAVVAQQQMVDAMQKDLDHSVDNLRGVLRAKLDLDNETLRRMGERRDSAKSDLVKQSAASESFEDAQKDFEQEQRILESLKLKRMEVGAQVAAGGKPGEVALGLADMADSKSASALAAEVPGRGAGGDVRAGRVKPADMPALARSDEREAKLSAAPVVEALPPAPPAEVPAGLAILDQSLSDVASSSPLQSGAGGGSGGGLGGGRGPGELSKRSKTERPAGGSTDDAIAQNAPAKDVSGQTQGVKDEPGNPVPTGRVDIAGNTKLPRAILLREKRPEGDALAAGLPEATATNATGIVTSGLRSGSGAVTRNNIDGVLNNPGQGSGYDQKQMEGLAESDVAPGLYARQLKGGEVGFGYLGRTSGDDQLPAGAVSGTRDWSLNGSFGDLGVKDPGPDLARDYADHYILAGAEYRISDSTVITSGKPVAGALYQAQPDLNGELKNSYHYFEPDCATGAAIPRFTSRGYVESESLKSLQDLFSSSSLTAGASNFELSDSSLNPAQQELKSPPVEPAPEKPKEPNLKEISAADEAFSTFSLHVSDVSFRLAKAALDRGERPDPASIREEEFYNAVEYGDPATAKDEPVACVVEQSAHPVRPQRDLVRIGIRTGSSGRAAATPLSLVLLLDSSGSMERDDRHAGLVKAVQELSSLLKEGDTVTVVGFSRKPRLLVDRLPGKDAAKLNEIIANSPIEGGTDLAQGLKIAGELAERQFQSKAQNRVVLFTDGAANLGDADPQSLAKMIVQLRGKHIAFDAAGFGAEGLNDKLLEQLTRDGDGRYYVVNRPEDAGDQFAKQLAGAFRPAAENMKVQVRFNAARVGKYRLAGFAEHRLQTEDFHNDSVDAAEMAAEEAGNALYEVEPLPEGEGEIGEVSVRFRNAATGEMVERTWTIPYEPQSPAFDKARPSMQLAGLALLTAEKLQDGPAADAIDFNTMATVMASVRQAYGSTAGAAQLLEMIGKLR